VVLQHEWGGELLVQRRQGRMGGLFRAARREVRGRRGGALVGCRGYPCGSNTLAWERKEDCDRTTSKRGSLP
jgi:hypothetical protein